MGKLLECKRAILFPGWLNSFSQGGQILIRPSISVQCPFDGLPLTKCCRHADGRLMLNPAVPYSSGGTLYKDWLFEARSHKSSNSP